MKRTYLLLLIPALLLAGCGHKHTPGPEADCTADQICTECGELLTPAIGHNPGVTASCTEPQVCTLCGTVLAEALGHEPGPAATCTEPRVCTRCGVVLEDSIGHTEQENGCTGPVTCSVCGEVLGEAPGHREQWNGCLLPVTCSICGEELSAPAGHIEGEATCTGGTYCTVCGERVTGAKGHTVDSESGLCTVCGEQVTQPGWLYVAPGAHGENSEDAGSVIPETVNTGHYNNNIDAYYSKNVLVCGDYAMEYFRSDETGSSNYANIVSDFAEYYPEIRVTSLLVPKCAAYETPNHYIDAHDSIASFIASTYAMMSDRVIKADAMGVMDLHAGEYMFYRTDHHWNSLGAYYASVAYCDANGIAPRPLEDYEVVIRTGVIGTLDYYAGGIASLKENPDYTACHFPATGYTMRYTWGGGSWYNGLAIDAENRGYAYVYMEGDVPLTVIETDLKNGKTLLVFKESYGNCFIPYMIDYYERIVVVDIREDTESVASLIEKYGVTDALIINNVQAATSLQSTLRKKLMS